jgi:hypothetical protein
MVRASKTKKPVSAESVARMADGGQNVSGFFTNRGKMMRPIQRVNVDHCPDSTRTGKISPT